jgi:hypothetical protein
MTAEEVINLIGGICGLIFFVFIAWLVIKKPPFPIKTTKMSEALNQNKDE